MIVGMGTDLAELDRIQHSINKYGQRFLSRVYTEREIAYSMRKKNFAERLAGRFAAKEAGMKAEQVVDAVSRGKTLKSSMSRAVDPHFASLAPQPGLPIKWERQRSRSRSRTLQRSPWRL
jgi:phosphopantetheinyl transferase (holo-ACP synthase)